MSKTVISVGEGIKIKWISIGIWGFQWKPKRPRDSVYQTDPGSKKFSEPETRAIEKTIRSFNPNVFLSIHSGMNALMFPYAYSMKTRNFLMYTFL